MTYNIGWTLIVNSLLFKSSIPKSLSLLHVTVTWQENITTVNPEEN